MFVRNHEYGWPVPVMWRTVPRESNPGNSGVGSRLPVASNQSGLGPESTLIPCSGQTGEWLTTPSG